MKTKLAFTLVELLVVVSIIALMSTTSAFYFIKYIEGKGLEKDMELFADKIIALDHEVAVKSLSNYEIILKPAKGFTYSLNADDGQKSFFLSSDFLTGKFTIDNDITFPTSWTMKIFSGNKFQQQAEVSSQDTFSLTFRKDQENTVESYLSGSLTNTLKAVYFSEDNLLTNISKHTRIAKINSQADGTGTPYPQIYIRNFNGRKTLSDETNTFSQVYVFFEKGSYTDIFLLTNRVGR